MAIAAVIAGVPATLPANLPGGSSTAASAGDGKGPLPAAATVAEARATPIVPASDEAVKSAAAEIDAFVRNSGRDIVFQVDKGTGKTVVSVRDAATGQTIRQIPSEEVLRIAQDLQQKQSPDGLLADTMA